jgi:hypothetical protein
MSRDHPRDRTLPGSADPSRIDIHAPAERRRWVREIVLSGQEIAFDK